MITNTHSVGVVRDAVIAWRVEQAAARPTRLVVAAGRGRTWDGYLNDINGFHVKPEATSSRRWTPRSRTRRRRQRGRRYRHDLLRIQGRHRHLLPPLATAGGYTVGVLVQCNYGLRAQLAHRRASRWGRKSPRGARSRDGRPARSSSSLPPTPRCCRTNEAPGPAASSAWRAPAAFRQRLRRYLHRLLHRQRQAPAKRTGSPSPCSPTIRSTPLFAGTVQATEEAMSTPWSARKP